MVETVLLALAVVDEVTRKTVAKRPRCILGSSNALVAKVLNPDANLLHIVVAAGITDIPAGQYRYGELERNAFDGELLGDQTLNT